MTSRTDLGKYLITTPLKLKMEQLQLLLDKLHNSAYVFSSIVYHLVAHDNDLKLGFSASVCTEGRYTQCGDGSVAAAAFLLSHSLRYLNVIV